MEPNEKVNRLPETPTPDLATAAYSELQELLNYAPAEQWRGWFETMMTIAVTDELWTEQPENERAANVAGLFKLIRAFETMESKA